MHWVARDLDTTSIVGLDQHAAPKPLNEAER
jgi:hypothetical protein